jgi:ATP-binding cassette subfamily F protein 2
VKPTLLLLDEPTNHLDLVACVWLEEYLKKYDRCLFIVSHSQDFLNGVCTNIIELTPKKSLVTYSGNYDQFMITKKENEVNQMKRYKKEQEDIKHIKSFIASCGTYANLVKQAKSKQKILDKMEAKGLTEKVEKGHTFKFFFNECEKLPPPIMHFQKVGFSYSGEMKDALYKNLDLGIDLESRIALVGPNGAGKTTLLKLMVGELVPTSGQIRSHLALTIGRYHQHSADALDMTATPLEFLPRQFPNLKKEIQEWRGILGKYGISGEAQKVKIATLSDGVKSRLCMCLIAMRTPHLLLFDEPTNHLDMDCIDSLASAINEYQGGVVVVSHDFRLLQQIAKTIWVCDNKTVSVWKGDIRSYKTSLVKKMLAESS